MSEYNIQMNKYNALNAEYDQLYPQPMKHASTHAEDGNDPITPSMIGTYNKTEIDTALQNNDPRNWGLDLSKYLTDANDGTRNGFYAMTVGAANVPFDYGVLLVHNLGNPNYVHQELTEYFGGIKACRGGTWDESTSAVKWEPWEYVNPPMLLGVEYRTTERFNGKPVYTKLFNSGALPAVGTSKTVTFAGDANTAEGYRCISVIAAVGALSVSGGWGFTAPSTSAMEVSGGYNTVRIVSNIDFSPVSGTADIIVKYWKTTD